MAFSGLGVIAQFHSPLKASDWNGSRHQAADSGRRVLVKQLGRGISETTVANGEDVDAALLAAIQEKPKDGDAPEIDPFEDMKVIEQLSLAEVDDVVPDGDSFKITLRVLGATTFHLLKMPSSKDVFEYRPIFNNVSRGCSTCPSTARR